MPISDEALPINIQRQLSLEEERRRERDIIDQLHSNREEWINARRDELFIDDETLTMPAAHEQASAEFEEQFGAAVTTAYGDVAERAPRLPIVGEVTPEPIPRDLPAFEEAEPTLSEVLGTQTVVGPEQAEQEARRAEAATTINWDVVSEELELDEPTTNAIRNAFNIHSAENVSETDQLKLFNETLEEIGGIESVVAPPEPEEGEVTTSEAFQRQIEEAGVPEYSPVQLAFLDSIYKQQVEEAKEGLREETLRVYDIGGVEYPADAGISPSAFPLDVQHQMTEANIVERPLTEEELDNRARDIVGQPWYTDPARVRAQAEDPEGFAREFARQESTSILNIQTPFGTAETGLGQFSRLAMSLLSMPMIAVLEEAATPQVSRAKGTERAERGGERWREHPYLFNISRGLGATGEASLTADALNIEGPLKAAVTAGGLAADLLDPTFGVLLATGRGIRAASQASRLSRAQRTAARAAATAVMQKRPVR